MKQQWRAVELALAAKLINRDTAPGQGVGKNELAGLRDGIVVGAKEANLKGSFHLLTFICECDNCINPSGPKRRNTYVAGIATKSKSQTC